ncbi:MAG TPA: DUF1349 domain-containing protein [Actinobacteria bacterium]|jgi:regulation of enolase protein 1 (concanavalin A-like superfamily)|nr:DUF1349 domain-containing protein [Actinomycetota bacterium]
MTVAGGWEGFTWVNEPVRWEVDATGRLEWDTRPVSDFWRHTGGVMGADDGDAFLLACAGDFSVTMRLSCDFASPYDQCGLMVRVDERNWLKAGVELDGGPWFSVVETREHSDWSKQAISSGDAEFTLWRDGDTLRVGLVDEGMTHLVRELVFDGPVAVGPYSCSPSGPGFPVSVTTAPGSDGGVLMVAQAGRPVAAGLK